MARNREPGDALSIEFVPSATVKPLIRIKETDTLARARTLMELHNFSQLPVVRGEKPVGAVTWESIGRAVLDNPVASLKSCIERNAPTVALEDDLLDVIPMINASGYALVVAANGMLSGIVTSADLGDELDHLARPFLLIERLESRLRSTLRTVTSAASDRDQADAEESGPQPEDLTLGRLVGALDERKVWDRVGTIYDPKVLRDELGKAVDFRNRLMHFRRLEEHHGFTLQTLKRLVAVVEKIETQLRGQTASVRAR